MADIKYEIKESYGELSSSDKGWTKEEFDSISQEERDVAVECIYF